MRSRMGPKCETDPSAPAVHMENLGEVLLEALHPQTMQVNTREFCRELPVPSGRRLNSSLPDHRRVFVGIGEGSHSARGHQNLARWFRGNVLKGRARSSPRRVKVNPVTKV